MATFEEENDLALARSKHMISLTPNQVDQYRLKGFYVRENTQLQSGEKFFVARYENVVDQKLFAVPRNPSYPHKYRIIALLTPLHFKYIVSGNLDDTGVWALAYEYIGASGIPDSRGGKMKTIAMDNMNLLID